MDKVLTLLILILSHLLVAQPTQLAEYFTQVRKQQDGTIPKVVLAPENAKSVLNSLPVYLKDSVDQVRGRAMVIVRSIGIQSKLAAIQHESIQLLIKSIRDKNTGNSGSAITYLTEFKQGNFNQADKDSITSVFKIKSLRSPGLIKLIGFVELKELQNDLSEISRSRTEGKVERWSALLALARVGDEAAANNLLSRIQKIEVSDDMIYQLVPDLVYTRSKPILDYLVEIINSDAKNCYATNANRNESILCGYRVMEMIAPAIKDYPLQVDSSGDVITTDYEQALKTVRAWLKANKQYLILKDRF